MRLGWVLRSYFRGGDFREERRVMAEGLRVVGGIGLQGDVGWEKSKRSTVGVIGGCGWGFFSIGMSLVKCSRSTLTLLPELLPELFPELGPELLPELLPDPLVVSYLLVKLLFSC
jgi:hypothetical protein